MIPLETPVEGKSELPKPVKSWVLIEAPLDVSHRRFTSSGISIKVDDVPDAVIFANQHFYICVDCGKCYWGAITRNFLESFEVVYMVSLFF